MILKLGYVEVGGIVSFRYIDDFTELRITSFITEQFIYHLDKDILVFDKKHEMKDTEFLFSKKVLEENKVDHMKVNYIYFLDKSGRICTYACLSDSVYLMNDNGKTIDKY